MQLEGLALVGRQPELEARLALLDPIEMVAAARIAEKLFDRRRIREIAVARWSADRMARDYLRVYRAAQVDRLLEEPEAAGA